MTRPPPLDIDPPLLNTANPWATDLGHLTALYDCPYTGAVTTRTSTLSGFPHDPAVHQFTFFDATAHDPAATATAASGGEGGEKPTTASLNTLGYSPIPLDVYLGFIRQIVAARENKSQEPQKEEGIRASAAAAPRKGKCFIVSVTGTPADVAECYRLIATAQSELSVPLAMEVNLSCPNIQGTPPPAYDGIALLGYLTALQKIIYDAEAGDEHQQKRMPRIPFGLKLPPYTHAGQFALLVGALGGAAVVTLDCVCPVSFLTATNTLGSSLVMTSSTSSTPSGGPQAVPTPALSGTGIGGMAGAPLHPIALGNVATLRGMLDAEAAALGHIRIIGAGGVSDRAGFERMRSVGAYAVGVATGLGIHGMDVFGRISKQ